jgi:hypothetical protein
MAQNTTTTLWLYLARRDSKGVKILATLSGRRQSPVRLTDTSLLSLPSPWKTRIDQLIFEERMLWEPWIETADNFEDLKDSLKGRGYTELPVSGQALFSRADFLSFPEVNVNRLPKQKVMLRKTST